MTNPLRVMAWNVEGVHFRDDSVHNAVGDFQPIRNPNGVWSYGYSVKANSDRVLIPFDHGVEDQVGGLKKQAWTRSAYNPNGTPAIWRNLSTVFQFGVAPGQLSLHPGPLANGDIAILRFTAPPPPLFHGESGPTYKIKGRFMAGDSGRMSGTIVAHRNGADETLYDVPVTADNSFFDVDTRLGSGETLDFIVGNNGDYTSGNTPIEVSIHAVGQEEKLNAIAGTIVAARPDLVLLNEVCVWAPWFNGGVNQVETLAAKAGLPYSRWAQTTALGVGGTMAVGVLSLYPLGPATRRPIMRGNTETKYAMVDTSFVANGQTHRVLSLRLDAWNATDNEAGHRQLMALVGGIDARVPVILGGDFNAPKEMIPNDPNTANFDTPWFAEFVAQSGLTCLQSERPVLGIDHIFYRGPYRTLQVEVTGGPSWASDHPFVAGQMVPLNDEPFTDGSSLTTTDAADEILVQVQHGALGPDEVEFVLEAGPSVTWRKEIIIAEGPGTGTGRWTIFTVDAKKSDHNGLYLYQLPGATLTFRKAKSFGIVITVQVVGIDKLMGGTRVSFRWAKD